MTDCAMLVLSCDKYESYWKGWYHFWRKHWDPQIKIPVYFAVEEKNLPDWPDILPIHVGGSLAWGGCLLSALRQLPPEIQTVFFSLEDYWPTVRMTKELFLSLYNEFKSRDVSCLRCSPPSHYYRFFPDGKFREDSPYLVSCQTSLWERWFLASCAEPEETPWQFEIQGTERLRGRGLASRIAFHPLSWYAHACLRGKWTKEGKCLNDQMMKDASFSLNS